MTSRRRLLFYQFLKPKLTKLDLLCYCRIWNMSRTKVYLDNVSSICNIPPKNPLWLIGAYEFVA
jgi:hypothetical protein